MTESRATPHYVSLFTDPDQIVALAARNGVPVISTFERGYDRSAFSRRSRLSASQ
jgi:hypothetical protein